jgi:hypothetical protein
VILAERIEIAGVDTELDRISVLRMPHFPQMLPWRGLCAPGDELDGLGYVSRRLHTVSDHFIRFGKIGKLQVASEETTQLSTRNPPFAAFLIIALSCLFLVGFQRSIRRDGR